MDNCLPILFASGTYYEVSKLIGKTYKTRIHEYYKEFEDLHEKFLPFYHTPEGAKICEDYLKVIKSSFPQYEKEMKGLADGAEIPFEQVLLIHLRAELQTYLRKPQVSECSTIYINNEKSCAILHNEDTSAAVINKGYVVCVHIKENAPLGKHNIQEEKFVAYCYPGTIPGNSVNVNHHGFIFTLNALYPELLQLARTPRQIINRAVLCGSSLEQIRSIFVDEGDGISTGCSTNVGKLDQAERIMWNFELCPSENERKSVLSELSVGVDGSVQSNVTGHYNHFNMYKQMKIKEIPGRTTSSNHRQKRADQLLVPTKVKEGLFVLGDTEDEAYPIYRTPRPTDIGATVMTAVVDILQERISMYIGNPKLNPDPVLKLSLKDLF